MFRLIFATAPDDPESPRTPDEIADAVQEVADQIRAGHGKGRVRNGSGIGIGEYDVASPDEVAW